MSQQPKYDFQSALYRSEREMLDAIAEAWMTGGGQNSKQDQEQALAAMSDRALADECISGWNLDERSGQEEPENWDDEDAAMVPVEDSHMDRNDYSKQALEAAFRRYRSELLGVAYD